MRDEATLRISAGAESAAGPLVTAMAARAGLTLQELDELEMAVELVLSEGPANRELVLVADEGSLAITIRPVSERWAARVQGLLTQLVAGVASGDGGLELRAGP
jgi:hypothetical protein